ncbi:unnamed protein product [Cuscuta epithymum]|uniref:Uncharacterized protein n=1 Tax=Cuscuta epithymum TaxID=186058 RepID=A0AAV0C879_9ASTE|nr:unnamed protein product [Cuscuta epithymum]
MGIYYPTMVLSLRGLNTSSEKTSPKQPKNLLNHKNPQKSVLENEKKNEETTISDLKSPKSDRSVGRRPSPCPPLHLVWQLKLEAAGTAPSQAAAPDLIHPRWSAINGRLRASGRDE